MKKLEITLFLFLLGSILYAQTDSTEKALLYNKVLSGEIAPEEFSKIGVKWMETMKRFGDYPNLPVDSAGQVGYSYVITYAGVPKNTLFNRTLEWLSIHYGLIPSYLYSCMEDGKIIFKNSFPVNDTYTCIYTGVVTVKDEKILFEYQSVGLQYFCSGYYKNDVWVPEKTIMIGLMDIYPVVLKKQSEWSANLLLLKTTNDYFPAEAKSLCNYINEYDQRYKF